MQLFAVATVTESIQIGYGIAFYVGDGWLRATGGRHTMRTSCAMTQKPTRVLLAGGTALLAMTVGCATKNYVRNQTTPMIQHTNELDDEAAANRRNLDAVNERAQTGIQQAQNAAQAADQKAVSAGQSANQAQQSAQEALNHADTLESVVSNLDTYHQVADANVHFGFDKATLTSKDKQQLDSFAGQLASTKSYILEITGGTDSTGDKAYNYQLSERRAENVAQYLAEKYNVPPHKFYLIGIGKDVEVASNRNAAGRAKNRRVEIQLLSNATAPSGQGAPSSAQSGNGNPNGNSNQGMNPTQQTGAQASN
jgi:OOP family OmpA-OmpF porin